MIYAGLQQDARGFHMMVEGKRVDVTHPVEIVFREGSFLGDSADDRKAKLFTVVNGVTKRVF